jgi:hypothetical protein
MQEWNTMHEVTKALISTLASLVTLAVALGSGWLIGNRVAYKWNLRQKRREIQLSALQQFYAAYGEFFAIWKLWNSLVKRSNVSDELRWELHKRAAAAEGIIEGTFVKLSTEIELKDEDIRYLGQFRQRFQQLRESIRDEMELPWKNSEYSDYVEFKRLSTCVSLLLGSDWNHPCSPERAQRQLLDITSNRFEKH